METKTHNLNTDVNIYFLFLTTLPDKGSLQMEVFLFQAAPCAVIVPRRNTPTRT